MTLEMIHRRSLTVILLQELLCPISRTGLYDSQMWVMLIKIITRTRGTDVITIVIGYIQQDTSLPLTACVLCY